MQAQDKKKRIAIIGTGPSGLYVFGRLVHSGRKDVEIHLFEKKSIPASGFPYSTEGANEEHVTNVSDNEIPHLETTIKEWIQTVPEQTLKKFSIDPDKFNEYKVIPRLLFGQYLSAQFDLLLNKAKKTGIFTKVFLNSTIEDVTMNPAGNVSIITEAKETLEFDYVIICTGHHWPVKNEGKIPGYYDSPYPPIKLKKTFNHPVAIRGSSLTAIDAIRTLARHNGTFKESSNGEVAFIPGNQSPDFKLVMHSRNGMLPAIRFHLEDSHLSADSLLSEEEIIKNRSENNGFLSLDFVFEKDFKDKLKEADPDFYNKIRSMNLEEFVQMMMQKRESSDAFELFKKEYEEAERSIRRRESIYWKEMLAVLSFAMNHPAKYLSAEDMIRLQSALMPLISIVIAFVPQSSCKELLALHKAGRLEIVSVGSENSIDIIEEGGIKYRYTDENNTEQSVYFKTFVDSIGQPHLSYEDFPFKGLMKQKAVSRARLKFKSSREGSLALKNGNKNVEQDQSGSFFLKVPGLAISDCFQVIDPNNQVSENLFIMAVPYIGGFNPDYSGLDFSEYASDLIVNRILSEKKEVLQEINK